jgi:hypothetical protein
MPIYRLLLRYSIGIPGSTLSHPWALKIEDFFSDSPLEWLQGKEVSFYFHKYQGKNYLEQCINVKHSGFDYLKLNVAAVPSTADVHVTDICCYR